MSATNRLYKITPILNERLWGKERLSELLHVHSDESRIGEAFLVSSMPEAETQIDGMDFSEFYQKNKSELFGLTRVLFPLRVNLIDSKEALSIQVHPDGKLAEAWGYPQGVVEAWLVLESDPTSKIEVGHTASTTSELKQRIEEGDWNQLLNYQDARPDDFILLPPGTIHAIGENILIYELTYNLDITYRVYDYDRVSQITGKKRELHLTEALSVIQTPQIIAQPIPNIKHHNGYTETVYIDQEEIFTLIKWEIDKECILSLDHFSLCTVIKGQGSIQDQPVHQFETWFIPNDTGKVSVTGKMTLLSASYREKKGNL